MAACSQDRQQACFPPRNDTECPARPAMGSSAQHRCRTGLLSRCRGGYGVAPVGKVHSGTPLWAGEPMVVCSDWIQRVALGEPRMM